MGPRPLGRGNQYGSLVEHTERLLQWGHVLSDVETAVS